MSITEMIVTALIWFLTVCGIFFGLRARWRRRRQRHPQHPRQRPLDK